MTLSRWHEQMIEDLQHQIGNDEECNLHKTILPTGEIRSLLHGRSVYSVRRNSVLYCLNGKVYLLCIFIRIVLASDRRSDSKQAEN